MYTKVATNVPNVESKLDIDVKTLVSPKRWKIVVSSLFVVCVALSLVSFFMLCKYVDILPSAIKFSSYGLQQCHVQHVPVPSVDKMILDEKIGQMTQVEKNSVSFDDDIRKYMIGSVLSGGGGGPTWGNRPENWAEMIDNFQAKASQTRLRIPIVYGADAVHGHNNVYGTTIFPHHIGMGASRNPELVQQVASAAAKEVAATGVRWTFSPAVSVCRDPRWGRCYESYSQLPEIVGNMTSEITGWQTVPFGTVPGTVFVAATAKHFVGDGGTQSGTDEGNTVISEDDLRRVHLAPYRDAIRRQVQTVMVSYSSWNSEQMHANRYLVTDVLKGELGFKGVVVSDWAAIQKLPGTWADQVRSSINAGLDMIMVPSDYKQFISTLRAEVLAGRVPMSRIDDAVQRILSLKQSLGLFENACSVKSLIPTIGSPDHRQLGRQAVRESLVLLKNQMRKEHGSQGPQGLLPLTGTKSTTILVAGHHANDIGLQCGGWTISWQGQAGNITLGTTILEGVLEVAKEVTGGAQVEYVEYPTGEESADYGIVVIGEAPYAEFKGDNAALQLDSSSLALVDLVCSRMPCVLVLISGRPLEVRHVLRKVDALVAAWLPGSEGGGVADVLFGKVGFKGRLPMAWFNDTLQLPMAVGSGKEPLFPVGFGLGFDGKLL